jgi:hypothetical protein
VTITTNTASVNLGSIQPTISGAINSGSVTATVTTNATSGYTLSMKSDNADMIHQTQSSARLTPIAGTSLNPVQFRQDGCNKWGYALPRSQTGLYGLMPNNFLTNYPTLNNAAVADNATIWAAVPTSDLMIKRLNTPTAGDTTQVNFAACANLTMTAGTYTAQITFTAAIADPTDSGDGVGGDPIMDIDSNMVPVKYATTPLGLPEWQKADSTNQNNDWYSYNDKRWANAVSFTDSSKLTQYQAAPIGTVIPESDIGAYWVYIPRYRYQLQAIDYATRPTTPTPFSIQFEDMSQPGYIKADPKNAQIQPMTGDWMTHPAFTLGTTELNGIWVGKFETTGTAAAPTVKPNQTSLKSQNILNQWNTSRTGRTYQNLSTAADTRMMRNDDWGAVAYLASSIYGTGVSTSTSEPGTALGAADKGVRINGNSAMVTGCGPTNDSGSTTTYAGTTTCTPTSDNIDRSYYTTLGQFASTTGNTTGIYDMSGGAYEYTLSNFNGAVGSSGLTTNGSGGFTQIDSKYLNFYDATMTMANCTVLTCGGQALYETRWNGDYAYFVDSSNPWSRRGGGYGDGSSAGLFDSNYYDGYALSIFGWRFLQSAF